MARFSWFVILAAMRTGSNLLEESLNSVPGISCLGEAFNPVFIGHPGQAGILGVSQAERDAQPDGLLRKIAEAPGMTGFRYFPDHDPRVLDPILSDPACAKIVLGRNPAESYVSLKIARETGQWRLTDPRQRRAALVRFDAEEFAEHLDQLEDFRARVRRALMVSGQTAFWLDYRDLTDPGVLSGVLRFLGVQGDARPAGALVPQNPGDLSEKVSNPAEMRSALVARDPYGLSFPPSFEARRGPGVPRFAAAGNGALLFMPVAGGPTAAVSAWLSGISGGVERGFTQSTLRDWMRDHPGHRRFTVLRHPVVRAHAAFRDLFLAGARGEVADQIARLHKIEASGLDQPVPRRRAFAQFLRFLKANLNGQTAVRTDAAWASQTAILAGFSGFAPPDLVAREDRLGDDLARLCAGLGLPCPPVAADPSDGVAEICDDDIQALARAAYARDYVTFGFGPWRG